jgi:hypothetical protein
VKRRINFDRIKAAASPQLRHILAAWLPGGRIQGREYVVRNPKRNDRRPGSFCINIDTGKWADFAEGARGGDIISLAAYLADISQVEAARNVAKMLGLEAHHVA